MSFIEKLDEKSLEVFNDAASKPYSQQAVFFLNAFWDEFGDQAEYIYAVAWYIMCQGDMEAKGISYVHQYKEGFDLDFDLGIWFFEHVVKFNDDHKDYSKSHSDWKKKNPDWKEKFKKSFPKMQTSVVRKKELKEKVDVNFDGRVSLLEYLLYQYEASPKDLVGRMMSAPTEDEAVRKAREALEEVNKRIAAYEAEKQRLTELAEKETGVKGLKAKNELAQLNSSPLMESLNRALITAEAAVRIATKKMQAGGGGGGGGGGSASPGRTAGAIWWMNRDLAEKQEKYGKKKDK